MPKPDGWQRPLAIAALEDKIVQRATTVVLNAIYEEDAVTKPFTTLGAIQ
jgi:RNA-directed DNA polymerase